jgi:3-oxoacyl-[acyl-carrier protein] reductase
MCRIGRWSISLTDGSGREIYEWGGFQMRLTGKVALITGGATGIGREIGLAFAREGANVAVNYSRSEKEAEETTGEIRKLGVQSIMLKADVSDDSQVKQMVREVDSQFGGLDILVNNAGFTKFVPFDDLEGLTDELWDRVMAVNLMGTFYCTRAVIPLLKRGGDGGGCIINTASIAGLIGIGSSIAYCASKGAVITLTKSFARSLAPDIRVNAIAPGFVKTRWVEGWEDHMQSHIDATPLGRLAQADDIAEVALFLATGARFVTGQVVIVDGGKTI